MSKKTRAWHVGLSDTGLLWWEGYADTQKEAEKIAEKELADYLDDWGSSWYFETYEITDRKPRL